MSVGMESNVLRITYLEVIGNAKYSPEIETLQHLIHLSEVHYVAGQGSQAKLKGLTSIKKCVCKRKQV